MNKEKSVHARMAAIKAELSKCKIPKSGHNKFSGFTYHELTDFMPFVNELNAKHGVNALPKFLKKQGICVLDVVNADDKTDNYQIVIPFVEAEMLAKGGAPSVVDPIQRLGSTITYNRRYLYMAAYDIVESDGIDTLPPNEPKTPQPETPQPKAEPKPTKEVVKDWEGLLAHCTANPADITKALNKYDFTLEQETQLKQLISK